MMAQYWRHLVKGSVQVILFVILFKYFGLPSWEKYKEEKTVVTSAEKDLGGIPAPTVTVCPANNETMIGYKNSSVRMENFPGGTFVFKLCKGLTGDDIVHCVENKTFGFSEVIKMASKGLLSFEGQFTDPRFWSPEFSWSAAGICYQLEANVTLGITKTLDVLRVVLNTSKSSIYIHDPNFFLASNNPGFPLNMMTISNTMKMHSFKLVRHNNLDLASKRCNPDPLYSFTRCIKTSFSKKIGCRLHWDRWTQLGLPACNTLDQYRWTDVDIFSFLAIFLPWP